MIQAFKLAMAGAMLAAAFAACVTYVFFIKSTFDVVTYEQKLKLYALECKWTGHPDADCMTFFGIGGGQ